MFKKDLGGVDAEIKALSWVRDGRGCAGWALYVVPTLHLGHMQAAVVMVVEAIMRTISSYHNGILLKWGSVC